MAHLAAGLLLSFGTAGCGLWIAFAAVGRIVSPQRRKCSLDIVSVGASAGQLIMVPIGQAFSALTVGKVRCFYLLFVSLQCCPNTDPIESPYHLYDVAL